MKRNTWILVGIVVVILLFLSHRITREHLTGQPVPTMTDVSSALNGVMTPVYTEITVWLLGYYPSATPQENLTSLIYFVLYGPNYIKASAPLSRSDFNSDFINIYNTGAPQFSVPAPLSPLAASDLNGNPWADIVYNYYYGPKSVTPYVAPTSTAGTLSPPTPTPPPPAGPSPAGSNVPSQSTPADVPSPCHAGLKSIPGGSMEFKCFS